MFELVPLAIAAITLACGSGLRALTHDAWLSVVVPCAGVPASSRAEPSAASALRLKQRSWRRRTLRLRFRDDCRRLPLDRRSPSAPLARGGRRGATAGARLRNAAEQIQPKAPLSSLVFFSPSPYVGARSVCYSKPGLTNVIFSGFFFFFSWLAVALRQLLSGPEANGIVLLLY